VHATSDTQAFEQSAAELLLFLRNVESVEIHIWSAGAAKPELVHSTKIKNVSAALRKSRDGMQRLPKLVMRS
jgi:hypothetical protein